MRVGIDIGGTKAGLLLLDDQGNIVQRSRVPTGKADGCEKTVQRIAQGYLDLLAQAGVSKNEIEYVGAGVPGTVDATATVVVHAPNLGWVQEPVSRYFEKYAGISLRLVQDTRAAAWAEARKMPHKKCVVCVTLGTGIGCGIVLNGRIWHGALGTAGEIGHIPVRLGGRACNCGRNGCMEAYASGTGLGVTARERGIAQSSEELFALAAQGNEAAKQVIAEAVELIAQDLTAVINILSPDAMLFSGGLCAQQELLVNPIIETLNRFAYREAVGEGLQLGIASLGGDAPAIGAAYLDESENR